MSIGSVALTVNAEFSDDIRAKVAAFNQSLARSVKDLNIGSQLDQAKLDAALSAAAVKVTKASDNIKIGANLQSAQIDAALADARVKILALSESTGNDAGEAMGKETASGFEGVMSPQVLVPAITAATALLPGAFAVAGAAGAVALGAAFALKGSPELQKQGESLVSGLEVTMEDAASVLDKPLAAALTSLEGELPTLQKLLGTTFTAVGPEIQPMVTMLTEIVNESLPGFNALMQDAQGPLSQFFVNAGKIVGTGLDRFFVALGPGAAASLGDITALLRLLMQVADTTAHVSSEIAGIPSLISKVGSAANSANAPLDNLGKSLKIPDANKNLFGALEDGVNWLTQHVPDGNKTLLDLAEGTNSAGSAAASTAPKIQNFANILASSKTPAESLAAAFDNVMNKQDADLTSIDNLNSAYEKFFGLIGSSQSALTSLSGDITSAASAIKQYGAGSLQANTAIGQLIGDNQTLVGDLKEQVSAAGNSSSAVEAMRKAFLDAASSQLTVANGSTVLQNALVAQAREAGVNVTSWSQLKGMLDNGKDSMNAASDAVNKLSQDQENNAAQAAIMDQAHAHLTGTLKSLESQGALTASQVSALTNAIVNDTGDVDTSQAAFEAFAGQLGITKTAADQLWTSLKQVAGDYAANVAINVSGGGTVSVTEQVNAIQSSGAPANIVNSGINAVAKARGGYVVGGHGPAGKDSVLALLAPGELVIPTGHAARYAAQAKKDGIPGFAGGGVVTGNPASAKSYIAKYAEPAYTMSVATSTGNVVRSSLAGLASGAMIGGYDSANITQPSYANVSTGAAYSYGVNNVPSGPLPVGAGSGQQMQPATQVQMMQLIQLIQQQNKLLAQQPDAYARALNAGVGQGARRAIFAIGG